MDLKPGVNKPRAMQNRSVMYCCVLISGVSSVPLNHYYIVMGDYLSKLKRVRTSEGAPSIGLVR